MHELEEAIKEGLRVAVLAVIPVVVTGLQDNELQWNLVWVTGAIALLRFADKYLHEKGKKENKPIMSKGLTRF